MYCPNCGEKENSLIQFCRTCGANLRIVRDSLEQSDLNTATSINAREEIARAAAEKIKTGTWWQVSAIVPEVEKLFESSQERKSRLQRNDQERRLSLLRGGTITSFVGVGLVMLFLLLSLADERILYLIGPGFLVFLIGLAILINGLYFSVPKTISEEKTLDEGISENFLTDKPITTPILFPLQSNYEHHSVVENTTKQLNKELMKENADTNKNIFKEKEIG